MAEKTIQDDAWWLPKSAGNWGNWGNWGKWAADTEKPKTDAQQTPDYAALDRQAKAANAANDTAGTTLEELGIISPAPAYTPPAPEKSLVDRLLADLDANYQRSDGGYGSLISAMQSRAPGDRAKLQALYDRYAQDIADQEAGVGQNYATAATNYGAAYDTTKANIQAAYDAAQQQQTQQMLALGLTGYAAPGELASGGAKAIANQEALRAAVLAQNEAARKAAITNNQLAVEGAKREGVGKVSSFDQKVADTLMQLQAKQQAAQAASANQYAQLRQSAISNAAKMSQDEAKLQLQADIAAMRYGNQGNPYIDMTSLVNQIKGNNSGLSDADAIALAKLQAQYSGNTAG